MRSDSVSIKDRCMLIEIGFFLVLAKSRVLIPAQGMLRVHVPTVHDGIKWLLEVEHVHRAVLLLSNFLFAPEVNAKKA